VEKCGRRKYITEEWKKFLRMARNRCILHMAMERMKNLQFFPHFVYVQYSVLLPVLISVTHALKNYNITPSFLTVGKSGVFVG